MATKRTVYLPDELARQIDDYLELHQSKNFSALVQETLRARVAPRDLSGILELAGFVESGGEPDDRFKDRPEDRFYDRAR